MMMTIMMPWDPRAVETEAVVAVALAVEDKVSGCCTDPLAFAVMDLLILNSHRVSANAKVVDDDENKSWNGAVESAKKMMKNGYQCCNVKHCVKGHDGSVANTRMSVKGARTGDDESGASWNRKMMKRWMNARMKQTTKKVRAACASLHSRQTMMTMTQRQRTATLAHYATRWPEWQWQQPWPDWLSNSEMTMMMSRKQTLKRKRTKLAALPLANSHEQTSCDHTVADADADAGADGVGDDDVLQLVRQRGRQKQKQQWDAIRDASHDRAWPETHNKDESVIVVI